MEFSLEDNIKSIRNFCFGVSSEPPNPMIEIEIDSRSIDKYRYGLINHYQEAIDNVEHNLEQHKNNTIEALKTFRPSVWFSSPTSRALNTGYFYWIKSDLGEDYFRKVVMSDLWSEQYYEYDINIIFHNIEGAYTDQSLPFKNSHEKDGIRFAFDDTGNIKINAHWYYENEEFRIRHGEYQKTLEAQDEDERERLVKKAYQSKKSKMFNCNYINNFPDTKRTVIWLTGHNGTSQFYFKKFAKNFFEVDNDKNIKEIGEKVSLKFGETKILNKNNLYILKRQTDAQVILDHIQDGRILLVTRHLKPEVTPARRDYVEGFPIDFSDYRKYSWPGKKYTPTTLEVEPFIKDIQQRLDLDNIKKITIEMVYANDDINIEGFPSDHHY